MCPFMRTRSMTLSRTLTSLALTLGLALPLGVHAEAVRATLDTGVIVGEAGPDGAVFKGVPFAAAPIGDLRWAPPQPVRPWTSERSASAYGPNCAQKLNPSGAPNEGGAVGPISEDCLFLNVWTPAHAAKAPVMVWLHGGGNTVGAGSLGAYDGSAFTRDGVILVTLNYRLGAFGFFAHPALTAAAKPDEPLVNYGLMDQIAALQWVKRNIAAFGGDPDNVTLFGESAGGQDTLLLMTSPAAQGLFAKAIVESGGGWGEMASLPRREAQDSALARNAGAPADATVAQLRALPMAKLIDWPALRGGPAVDGRLILEPTTQAFAVGHYAHVPLIIGSNSWEASLLKTFKAPPGATMAMVPPDAVRAYADIADPTAREQALFTDAVMGAPARWIAAKANRGAELPLSLRLCAGGPARERAGRGPRHRNPLRLRELGAPRRGRHGDQAEPRGPGDDGDHPRLLGELRQDGSADLPRRARLAGL